jgi:hypothetical protein
MKRITRLSLALIMFSLFSISYLVTSVSAQQRGMNFGNGNSAPLDENGQGGNVQMKAGVYSDECSKAKDGTAADRQNNNRGKLSRERCAELDLIRKNESERVISFDDTLMGSKPIGSRGPGPR